MCVAAGADIIDCKEPASGALGALPPDDVAAIRAVVPHGIPVSATIGDVNDPQQIGEQVAVMIAAGADLVKVGLFPDADHGAVLARLGSSQLRGVRLVGVLFADRSPDFALIGAMQRSGFAGVMLDTAHKSAGALPDVMPMQRLKDFISTARAAHLFAGLAGALRLSHIPRLLPLAPDVLGFRGALCRGGVRGNGVDEHAVAAVRSAIPRSGEDRGRAADGLAFAAIGRSP